jgi:glycosyltransferase involved in cell wall biosynthesis
MEVLFIPTSKGNPYQAELARHLSRHGIDVILKNEASILPILRVILNTGIPDILHLHWTHTLIKGRNTIEHLVKSLRLIGEIMFLKIAGLKIIWTVHNLWDHDKEENKIDAFCHMLLLRMCDAIIVHCENARHAVELCYCAPESAKKKISVVPHGNYISSYDNTAGRNKARKDLGFADHEIVFGFFGNIRSYKGIFNLVRAFQEVHRTGIRLVLAGKPESADIEEKLNVIAQRDERISMCLGFIPENRIQIYLNCMDVVVLPFQKVLTSGSVLLAMSYAKPVIAPATGCLQEVLDSPGSFLYDPDDPNSLICAMKKSIKADLEKMGKHNLRLALEADWRFSAKKTAKIYKAL